MLDTYYPILRNKQNEREVIQSFGGFSHFEQSSDQVLALKPVVEVTGDDDLGSLKPFKDAGDELLIDLPVYQASRDTDFGNAVETTIEDYGSRKEFFLDNSEKIEKPVLSSRIGGQINYGSHWLLQGALQEAYPTLVHRLMVRMNGPLTENQQETIRDLADELRPSDHVFFDVVDHGVNESLLSDLQFLAETFEENHRAVLNVFNVFNDERNNRSPKIAEKLGIGGFGDFAINVRYPGGGGRGDMAKVRHYFPNHAFVEEFEGPTYSDASDRLTAWEEWRTNHCDYCRDADRLTTGDASAWKRIRMGHYITSVLRNEI